MLSSVRLALFGLLASGLTACDSSSGSAPGAVSEGEAEALDEIAEELDRNRLPDEAIPQLREADNASTEVTGDSDASPAP